MPNKLPLLLETATSLEHFKENSNRMQVLHQSYLSQLREVLKCSMRRDETKQDKNIKVWQITVLHKLKFYAPVLFFDDKN